jgi:hypothetical protein
LGEVFGESCFGESVEGGEEGFDFSGI